MLLVKKPKPILAEISRQKRTNGTKHLAVFRRNRTQKGKSTLKKKRIHDKEKTQRACIPFCDKQ